VQPLRRFWLAISAALRQRFFFLPRFTRARATIMPDEEWIKKLEDGRNVKFTYQELPVDGAFITAQIEGHEVVYSVVLTNARNPLRREDVESHFKGELSKK
jgi:hypothetical protein